MNIPKKSGFVIVLLLLVQSILPVFCEETVQLVTKPWPPYQIYDEADENLTGISC